MELLVTERQNKCGENRYTNHVRISVQQVYDRSYWICEGTLLCFLSPYQREDYKKGVFRFDVTYDTISEILNFVSANYPGPGSRFS